MNALIQYKRLILKKSKKILKMRNKRDIRSYKLTHLDSGQVLQGDIEYKTWRINFKILLNQLNSIILTYSYLTNKLFQV